MAKACCLITGGSGFLGVNLVRHLLSNGLSVRSLDIAAFDYPERSRIDAILGDIRDPDSVDRAMIDAHDVVHCAAALPLASEVSPPTDMAGGSSGCGEVRSDAFIHTPLHPIRCVHR